MNEASWTLPPLIRNSDTSFRWVVSFTPRPLDPRGKKTRCPLNRGLGGPQSSSGRSEKEISLLLHRTLINWSVICFSLCDRERMSIHDYACLLLIGTLRHCWVLQNGCTCHTILQQWLYWRIPPSLEMGPFVSTLSTQIPGSDIPCLFLQCSLKRALVDEESKWFTTYKCRRRYHGYEHLYTCLWKHDQENWYVCIQSNGGEL
jgi:hypothetical protein